jgi:hypothetical protein
MRQSFRRERTFSAAGLALPFKIPYNVQSKTIQLSSVFNSASGDTQRHFIEVVASGAASNARINRARRTAEIIQVSRMKAMLFALRFNELLAASPHLNTPLHYTHR